MADYNFTVQRKHARGNEIHIDPARLYGYWERRDGSEGGGLWFELLPDGKLELIDYDGDYELPQAVVELLRAEGYVLDGECFDEMKGKH